jgi:hypothetical protein
MESWRTKLSGGTPLITEETLRNASLQCQYVNDKIKNELGFEFTPVAKTIEETAQLFLKEHTVT